LRRRDPYPPPRNIVVVAWTGMRGVVSLAAALALPEYLTDGQPFPGRNKILFFTFGVILATLVAQGLSLPALIRWLGVQRDCEAEREERQARLEANRAAMDRLDELATEESLPQTLVQRLRVEYEERIRELQGNGLEQAAEPDAATISPYTCLQQDALKVERRVILSLRNQRVISDEVMRRIEHDLDLAEARLHLSPQEH
jgi:NhaP-type Na+/H+ or K+/H+ antiporter